VQYGGTGIAGGSDTNVQDNYFTTGPSTTTGQCVGVNITVSAAPRIAGNEFNYNIAGTSGCIMIMMAPQTNNTSIGPLRISDNSVEGHGAGIAFFNACPTATSCLVSQICIDGNQILDRRRIRQWR
jgi:hypothetical protein